MITKEVFERYNKVRISGRINMFEIKNVCLLANISREECLEIMKNFEELSQKYDGVKE